MALQRPTPIVYGWWSVAIDLAVDACKQGTLNRGFTLDALPIRNARGFSVAALALAEMLGRLEGAHVRPCDGASHRRFGPGIMLAFVAPTSYQLPLPDHVHHLNPRHGSL